MPIGRTRLFADPRMARHTLRELDRRKPISEPSFFNDNSERPAAEKNPGRFIFVGGTTDQPQYSDGAEWRPFLSSVMYAVPATAYGTAFVEGTSTNVIRADATLKFPTAIMSSANLSTLTLTDDATDQTLTGSLGALNLRSGDDTLSLPLWTGGGENAATAGTVLGFTMQTSAAGVGNTLATGIAGQVSFNTASLTFTGTKRGAQFTVSPNATSGIVFSAVTMRAVDAITSPVTMTSTSGPHTFTEITALRGQAGMPIVSSSGNVTVTDAHGLHILGWPTSAGAGTTVYTNARGARIVLPTLGQTIRRGLSIETVTQNIGTEAANVEGIYVEDLARGTAQRASVYTEGATTGTPTDVYAFYQGTAHVVGTNRYGFRATGATTGTPTLCVGFYADAHSVGTTQWAFYSAGDESRMAGVQQDDNAKDVFGTGRDAEVYYDATNLILDPDVVGTGRLLVGATGDDDMLLTNIEIDGALNHDGTTLGVFNTAPTTVQTITGSRGGNAALASLLTGLAAYGLIVDSTTA